MRHQLFRQHVQFAFHRQRGNGCVQPQRQRDNHRFDIFVIKAGHDATIGRIVNLDLTTRFRLVLVASDLQQTWASPQRGGTTAVTMECTMLAEWADVANRFDIDVLRVASANQNVAFVARSDHSNANGILDLAIPEICGAQSGTTDDACGS